MFTCECGVEVKDEGQDCQECINDRNEIMKGIDDRCLKAGITQEELNQIDADALALMLEETSIKE